MLSVMYVRSYVCKQLYFELIACSRAIVIEETRTNMWPFQCLAQNHAEERQKASRYLIFTKFSYMRCRAVGHVHRENVQNC